MAERMYWLVTSELDKSRQWNAAAVYKLKRVAMYFAYGNRTAAHLLSDSLIKHGKNRFSREIQLHIRIELTTLYARSMHYELAHEHAKRADELSQFAESRFLRARSYEIMADSLFQGYRLQESIYWYKKADSLWVRMRRPLGQARVQISMAKVYLTLGWVDSALGSLERAEASIDGLPNRTVAHSTYCALSQLYALCGDRHRARTSQQVMYSFRPKNMLTGNFINEMLLRLTFQFLDRDYRRSLVTCRHLDALANRINERHLLPDVALAFGNAYLGLEQHQRAQSMYLACLDKIRPGFPNRLVMACDAIDGLALCFRLTGMHELSSRFNQIGFEIKTLLQGSLRVSSISEQTITVLLDSFEAAFAIATGRLPCEFTYRDKSIELNTREGEILKQGVVVGKLTETPMKVLRALFEASGMVLSHRDIVESVYGGDYIDRQDEDETGDSARSISTKARKYVQYIRHSFGEPTVIETIKGGYRLAID